MAFNLVFLAIILVVTLAGLGQRLFGAIINFLSVLVGVFLAFDFFEPIAHTFINSVPGLHSAVNSYVYAFSFMLLFLIGMTLVKYALTRSFGKTWVPIHGVVDSLGGLGVGFLTGILTAGVLSLFYYMLPFNQYAFERGAPLNQLVKPEEAVVNIVEHVSRRVPGGTRLDPAAFLNRYRDTWETSEAEPEKKPKRRKIVSPLEQDSPGDTVFDQPPREERSR